MKPILFNSESVRGILEDRKSQTRRVIKPQPEYRKYLGQDALYKKCFGYIGVESSKIFEYCPYKVADVLWVRETFNDWDGTNYRNPRYKAIDENYPDVPWKPSIFMPKKVARIWLDVTGVRVERVQDISGKDAQKEGWSHEQEMFPTINASDKAKRWFQIYWDSINAKRGYGWNTNCWVWVIEFKRIEKCLIK